MHMARRAAAWAAWAAWTCNIRHCGRTLQVPVTVKESGLRPALSLGALGDRLPGMRSRGGRARPAPYGEAEHNTQILLSFLFAQKHPLCLLKSCNFSYSTSLGLRPTQQRLDLQFQLFQIRFTLIPPDDTAIWIDEVTQGQSEDTAEALSELRVPHHDRVIQVVLLIYSLDRRGVIVHGYAHDPQASGSVSVLPSCESGHFGQARSAPCGPEIQ